MKEDNNKNKKPKVILVIPAYNEEENILKTYKSVMDYNNKNKTDYDVIVINDGSKDKTSSICHENNIPVIELIHNLGIGGAVQTGYKYIIEPIINKQADMVIGSRFVKNIDTFKSTFSRRIGINIISFFIKLVTRKKIYDTTSGFRAVNKKIIKDFASSYPVEYPEPLTTTEIIKKGYKISEVSVEMKEREGGVSSIRAWKSAYYMITVVVSIIIIGMRRYKKCK